MASGGAGCRPDRGKPRGRRRMERGRRPRVGEGRGKLGCAAWLGRKGSGSAQQRLPPFYFLKISFLQYFSKLILRNLNPFSALAPKTKVVLNKKFYNFVSSCNSEFPIEFEIPLKTSYRF